MRVVGVDGCPKGWVAVVWEDDSGAWDPQFHATFHEIVMAYPQATCIGVDIPIGLRDDGVARRCDIDARRRLGRPRMASVFPAPQRRLLRCRTYAEAAARSREHYGKGISQQAFGIFAKVEEVDRSMTPDFQQRVIEVHPELSFMAMNDGSPMTHSKKRVDGFTERSTLLRQHVAASVPALRSEARRLAPYAAPDDLLDALAVAWSARRFATNQAGRVPAEPERDERGLRMEIIF